MRDWIDLAEQWLLDEARDPYLPVIKAMWKHERENGSGQSWADIKYIYDGVKRFVSNGGEIYRGFAWEGLDDVDIRNDWDLREIDGYDFTPFHERIRQIDWTRVGTCWTEDWSSAQEGGVGFWEGKCHCIATARVSLAQIDVPRTVWQQIVHPREQEIRLRPNTPILITDIAPLPPGIAFPITANTGPERKDNDDDGYAYATMDFDV